MSASDQVTATLLTQLAQAADGALLGVGLAYVAVRSFVKYAAASSALAKIRSAPSVSVSDLRSLLPSAADHSSSSEAVSDGSGEMLVVLRGTVEAKSAVDGGWINLRTDALFSRNAGENAVVIKKAQSYIYNEWRSFNPWIYDLRALFGRAWREESSSTRSVPFILTQNGQHSQLDYVLVNMEGSKQPMPLITVYHHMEPISPTPYTFVQAVFGRDYPVGLLDEEKILPIGKEITAVGLCCLKDGVPEIKSFKDLPYFLSDMSKHQMIAELSFRAKVFMWSGIVIGTISLGMLGFSIIRNWNRWKEWRQQRRDRELHIEVDETAEDDEEEEGEVPEGQICIICLTRRRQSAFVPCGHLVCCQRCALSVEREAMPKCPVCRQPIRNSVRIYAS